MSTKFFIIGLLCLLTPLMVFSQAGHLPVSEEEKKEVIDSVSSILERNYIFPDVAKEIGTRLKQKWKEKKYASITDPFEFSRQLTQDIQSVNGDRHLSTRFDPEGIQLQQTAVNSEDSTTLEERWKRNGQRNNFGFKEVNILEGNIGYLNLTEFFDTRYGGETAQAAMNYLSNTDALIIDLRRNGGGSPSMIQLITSYLYGPEPVHLNNFYWRPQDLNTQTWTLPYVPGKRRPDIPVYVLTSSQTFSAAEEFSYNLRNLERATLVGETTGGGAHPGGPNIATDRFTVWVATGRAINPITNTNWEGVGVKPHLPVLAADAFDVAYLKALDTIKQVVPEYELAGLDWTIAGLKADKEKVTVPEKLLRKYAGQYGPRKLTFENGKLYYQRDNRPKTSLKALSKNLFALEGIPNFRIKMVVEDDEVTAIQGLYQDGRVDLNPREEKKINRP